MEKTGPGILKIDASAGSEEPLSLEASRLLRGSAMPEQHVRNVFTDSTGHFHSGIWRSTVGAWRVRYTENELCVITEGKVRLTDSAGRSWTFGPGDCFVVPSGFEGTWETLEPARKFYAIYEPPA